MNFTNPIIGGFNPDPSICRVGDDFYLATSSFAYFPGIPVYHSRDLVHWQLIGHCLTRDSQLPLAGASIKQGIWAPSLRFNNGTFYATATLMTPGAAENFYVTATNPAGDWSEPIGVDQKGIDPDIFFDDDGRVYYLTTHPLSEQPNGGIAISEIDLQTGTRLTEIRPLWPGTGGLAPEGPHLYKIKGLYYLMIAEGGTYSGHMETIARSRSVWGPYDACPHNPILTHRNNHSLRIQSTGHGDLVRTQTGEWWMVHLGIRQSFYQKSHLGRETFLTSVTWTEDGWPRVNGGKGVTELEMPGPELPRQAELAHSARDDFNTAVLGRQWVFLWNPQASRYSLNARPGWLRLKGGPDALDCPGGSPTFVCRRQTQPEMRAATLIELDANAGEGAEAGIAVFMAPDAFYQLGVRRQDGRRQVFVRRRLDDLTIETAVRDIGPDAVQLEVRGSVKEYAFGFRQNGSATIELDRAGSRYLCAETADTFSGVMLGLFAQHTRADFDWFEYNCPT